MHIFKNITFVLRLLVVFAFLFSQLSLAQTTGGKNCEAIELSNVISATTKPKISFRHSGEIRGFSLSKNEGRLLSWANDGTARIWDTSDGAEIRKISHGREVKHAQFSNFENKVLTLSDDSTVRIWDLPTGRQISALERDDSIYSASFSPDGQYILSLSRGKFSKFGHQTEAHLWQTSSGKRISALTHQDLKAAFFILDAKRILTTGGSTAKLWDGSSGELIATLDEGNDVFGVKFNESSQRIFSLRRDQTINSWNAFDGTQINIVFGEVDPESKLNDAFISPDGSILISTYSKTGPQIWDTKTGQKIGGAKTDLGVMMAPVFFPEINRVLMSWMAIDKSYDEENYAAQLWDLTSGKEVGLVYWHHYPVNDAILSPDNSSILIRSGDGRARILDAKSGEQIGQSLLHSETINGAQFTDNSAGILTWSGDGRVKFWDAKTGESLGPEVFHKSGIGDAIVFSDGNNILTRTYYASTLQIWDLHWTKIPTNVLRNCVADEIQKNKERQQEQDKQDKKKALNELSSFIANSKKQNTDYLISSTEASNKLPLFLSRETLPEDFPLTSLNHHPMDSYVYASSLFSEGHEEIASFWMYVGQLRYRAMNTCFNASPGDAEYAMLAVVQMNIGQEINEWLGGDVELWKQILDYVIDWYGGKTDPFVQNLKCDDAREKVFKGIKKLKGTLAKNTKKIRVERTKKGLENRN